MKGKLLKLETKLPDSIRFTPETYAGIAKGIRITGGNPYSQKELTELFDDLSIVRIVTKRGSITYFYEDEVIRFEFYPGFAHNTASVPGLFKPIVDNDSMKMYVAALPHDGLYTGHQMCKNEADTLFVDTIEWFHDNEGDEGFFENIGEDIIEAGIGFAFTTDEAQKSWDQGEHLSERSGAMMKVTRIKV